MTKTFEILERTLIDKIIQKLQEAYPDAQCELVYGTPIQLLVATILSAQCTDVRVNQVTVGLFAKYPLFLIGIRFCSLIWVFVYIGIYVFLAITE